MMDPMPAVLAVVAVLAAALWWLRKKGRVRPRGGRGRRLETMDRLALTAHHALFLVRLDDRAILVAQSPSGLALLDTSGQQESAAALRAAAPERG